MRQRSTSKTECHQNLDPLSHIRPFTVQGELPKTLRRFPAAVTRLAEVRIGDQIGDRLASVHGSPPQKRLEYRQCRLVELLRDHDGIGTTGRPSSMARGIPLSRLPSWLG